MPIYLCIARYTQNGNDKKRTLNYVYAAEDPNSVCKVARIKHQYGAAVPKMKNTKPMNANQAIFMQSGMSCILDLGLFLVIILRMMC